MKKTKSDSKLPSILAKKPKQQFETFDFFLKRMLTKGKLTPGLLQELVGKEATNRILDNSNNQIGAPTLGTGGAVPLQGQLHEYAGAIPDLKASIAAKMESLKKKELKNPPAEEENYEPHRPKPPYF